MYLTSSFYTAPSIVSTLYYLTVAVYGTSLPYRRRRRYYRRRRAVGRYGTLPYLTITTVTTAVAAATGNVYLVA